MKIFALIVGYENKYKKFIFIILSIGLFIIFFLKLIEKKELKSYIYVYGEGYSTIIYFFSKFKLSYLISSIVLLFHAIFLKNKRLAKIFNILIALSILLIFLNELIPIIFLFNIIN